MRIGDMGVRVMPGGYDVVTIHNYELKDKSYSWQVENYRTKAVHDSTKHVMHNKNQTGKGHGRHS